MQAMDRQLEAIGDRQERVREEREDWDLRQVLSRIEAGLQQMAGIPSRSSFGGTDTLWREWMGVRGTRQ